MQKYEHDDGIIFVFKNKSHDKALTENVFFNLIGMKVLDESFNDRF